MIMSNKHKIFGLFLLLMTGSISLCNAQIFDREEQKEEKNKGQDVQELPFKERLVFGGNLGLSFGSYTTINVSPKIGYLLTNKWMAGIGATYQYIKIKGNYGTYDDRIYGGELFTNYRIFDNFLLLGEYELINVKTQPVFANEPYRTWQPGTFLGIGYRQGLGGSVYADLQFMYNFSYQRGVSPYQNPYVINFNIFVL